MVLVKSVEVDIGVRGDADAKKKLDDITARADALKKAFPTYVLKIDSAAASERLRVFKGQLADATRDRTVKVRVDDSALQKFANNMKSGGGPAWLGPALALAPAAGTLTGVAAGATLGIAGAAVAGAAALAAFGAVAKPVLADALTAEQAVNTAQNNYQATIAAGVPKAQAQLALQTANSNAMLTYSAALKGGAKPATALAAYHLTLAKNQLTYNAATNAGVFQAKAYAAEQLAISKAYIELSPQQIALSQQLGDMANAWQNLKAAQTPVVAGALLPWLGSVTSLTGNLAPVIKAVSVPIGDLGRQVNLLIGTPTFTEFRDFIAGSGSFAAAQAGGALFDFFHSFIILLPQFSPLIDDASRGIGDLGAKVLAWSQTNKSSADIIKFMAWFSANGPVVGGLLVNIGGALKALAPGLTAGGAIELRLISDFFGFIARLPPSIAKPLAEVAGSLLILNKLGVFSVGVKLGGVIGGKFAETALGKALLAGGATSLILPVALVVGAIAGLSQVKDKTGGGTLLAPTSADLGFNGRWAKDIAGWYIVANDDVNRALDIGRHDVANRYIALNDDVNRILDIGRHDVANIYDGLNHDANRLLDIGRHDVAVKFDGIRHDVAASMDQTRADLANIWNSIWNNTIGRAARGVADTVGWFRGLPGRVTGSLGNAENVLLGWGGGVISGLLSGARSAWNGVVGFFKGIPGDILHALGIASPPPWSIEAGKHIMNGIGIGMTQAQSAATKAAKLVASTVSGYGRLSGSAGANQALGQRLAAARGWVGPLWNDLNAVEMMEAGWNPNAQNPTSGAYGIAQFINGPGEYYQYGGDPGTVSGQIFGMLNYISQRYGNPASALLHEQAFHWYGSGFDGMISSPTLIGVGERGPEHVTVTPGGRPSGGNTYVINVHPTPLARPADIGREVVGAIRAFEKGSGKGWRS